MLATLEFYSILICYSSSTETFSQRHISTTVVTLDALDLHLILALSVLLQQLLSTLSNKLLQLPFLSPTFITNKPTASNSKFTRQSRHNDSSFLPYQPGSSVTPLAEHRTENCLQTYFLNIYCPST